MLVGTQRINSQGHLEIGGCDALDLVQEFGSPLYVIDEQEVRQKCRDFKRAFADAWPNSEVTYAGKAFLPMAMCRLIDEEGLGLDVASGGELYTALQAKFPPERILFHGNNKSLQELQMAIEAGVGRIVVDNLLELETIRSLVSGTKPISILIRVTPGIDPHTHRRIRTGQADTKFGLGIPDGQAMLAVETALRIEGVKLLGLHCHAGSQLLDMSAHTAAAEIMVDFMDEVRTTTRWTAEELNLGGGFGVRYLPEQTPPSPEEAAHVMVSALKEKLNAKGLPHPRLLIEPGRAIVGEAGVTLYTIGAIKQVSIPEAPFQRLYVSVDGGMSDNPRPQLYDARYHALIADRANQPPDRVATIAGKHCETDILIWDLRLAEPAPGDVLAVLCTGAYNHAMSSNYNRLPRPALVFVNEGRAELVVRRETYTDLLLTEVIPERLRSQAARVIMDEQTTKILVFLIIMVFAIPLHEFGHALAAEYCGDDIPSLQGRVTLEPWVHWDLAGSLLMALGIFYGLAPFGWGKPVQTDPSHYRNGKAGRLLVASAGILVNLLLLLLGAILFRVLHGDAFANVLLRWFVFVNGMLVVFNLIPVPPLDGSKLLLWSLPPQTAARYLGVFQGIGVLILVTIVVLRPGIIAVPVAHLMHLVGVPLPPEAI